MTPSTDACLWSVIVLCSASATQTVPCAATSGRRYCPMTRSFWLRWKDRRSDPVNFAERNFPRMGNGHTAPISVQQRPGGSKLQPEYGSSEIRQSNHLALRSPCSARVFGGLLAFRREFYQNNENGKEKRYSSERHGLKMGGYAYGK